MAFIGVMDAWACVLLLGDLSTFRVLLVIFMCACVRFINVSMVNNGWLMCVCVRPCMRACVYVLAIRECVFLFCGVLTFLTTLISVTVSLVSENTL